MCSVSNITTDWLKTFPNDYPRYTTPLYYPPVNPVVGQQPYTIQWPTDYVPRAEFDKLKNEVEALKELLIAAKKFDAATGQPDCEIDEKVDVIKKVAKLVGIDMKEVFPD